jgi:hypothetical protein
MFVLPSTKRPGEAILTWGVAQQHLPWGILLLLGAGFAMADGCEASGLTLVLGRLLAEVSFGGRERMGTRYQEGHWQRLAYSPRRTTSAH